MPVSRDLVLYIHDGNPIETVAAQNARRDFSEFGVDVDEFSVLQADAAGKLRAFIRDKGERLLCFYSSNFWALNIRRDDKLLHTLTGIPLVILVQDHPVYFIHQMSRSLDGSILFVPGEELVDFVHRYYPVNATVLANPGFLPSTAHPVDPPELEQFMQRKNAVLSPMNLSIFGMTIEDVWDAIKALPRARSTRAQRLVDASLTDCMTPLHQISAALEGAGEPEVAPQDMRFVLNFVKLWRRIRVVEELIEFPGVFSTRHVPPHLASRHREKFTLLTRPQTLPLYNRYQFVANTNPMLTHCIHDRVTEALRGNAVCISDPSPLLLRYFRDGREMIFAGFEKGVLRDRVGPLLEDPEKAFAITQSAHAVQSRQRLSSDAFANLITMIEKARSQELHRID